MASRGLISSDDRALYFTTNDAVAAADEITGFYSNFHSLRFVGPNLYVRHTKRLKESEIAELNAEFSDLLADGSIVVSEPSKAERSENDRLDLERLKLRFDKRSYGRLRELINRLNQLGATS